MKKRLLSLLVCFVMLLSLLPTISLQAKADTIPEEFAVAGSNMTATQIQNWEGNDNADGTTLYYLDGDTYYPVTVVSDPAYYEMRTRHGQENDGSDYWYVKDNFSHTKADSESSGRNWVWGQTSAQNNDTNKPFYYIDTETNDIHRLYYNSQTHGFWNFIVKSYDCYLEIFYYTKSLDGSSVTSDSTMTSEMAAGNVRVLTNDGRDNHYTRNTNDTSSRLSYEWQSSVDIINDWVYPNKLYCPLYLYSGTSANKLAVYYEKDGYKYYVARNLTNGNYNPTCEGNLYYKVKQVEGTLEGNKSLSGLNEDGKYTLTIDSWATGNYQVPGQVTEAVPTPLDVVLVVDQSSSMSNEDLEGGELHYNSTNQTEWNLSDFQNGTQYYYEKDGKYYPVQLGTGNLFKAHDSVRGSSTFGWGNDGISVAVNGAPTYYNVKTYYYILTNDGKMHRLRAITAGLDLHYGFYPYVYLNEDDEYAQMGKWKDNHYWFRFISPWGANKLRNNTRWDTIIKDERISFVDTNGNLLGCSNEACNNAKMNYSWITDTAKINNLYTVDGSGYTHLYYVDDDGNKQIISNTRYFETDTELTTDKQLYTISGGMKRVTALENAVSDFVTALKEDADANSLTHKLAIVGYAQNGTNTAAAPTGAIVVGQDNPYTNTGVFSGNSYNSFTNYDDSPSYASALQDVSVVTFTNGTFGTWGGTYPSYGLDMANQILATDSNSSSKKVIIFFTDGEPGAYSYEVAAAEEALASGSEAKSGAEVYTIGLYPQSASTEAESFLQYLSSDYTGSLATVTSSSNLDTNQIYFYKNGTQYSAIYTNDDQLGWWEYITENGETTYNLINVKGANAGAGDEYLYTSSGTQVAGEDADQSQTYKSERGNDVKYEYHWLDVDNGDQDIGSDPVSKYSALYSLTQSKTAAGHYQKADTPTTLKEAFDNITVSLIKGAGSSEVDPVSYNDTNSIIQDTISSYFERTGNNDVTLKLIKAQLDENDDIQWLDSTGNVVDSADDAQSKDATGISANWSDSKTLQITGYDFSENYIQKDHPGWILRATVSNLKPTTTGPVYSNVESKSGIYEWDGTNVGDNLYRYNNPSVEVPTYTVRWSAQDSIIETDSGLAYGDMPSYDGDTPANYEKSGYYYTFVGWSDDEDAEEADAKAADELPAVTKDVTYYAIYHSAQVQNYTVNWIVEGETVETDTGLRNGDYPSYNGATPTKAASNGTNYVFVGWTTNSSYTYDASTLEQNIYIGEETVDQLAGTGNEVNLYAVFAPSSVVVNDKTLVLGFNAKLNIDTGVSGYEVVTQPGGTFALADNSVFSFTLNNGKTGDYRYDYTPMSSVNRAYYYKKDGDNFTEYDNVTVIPSSSIYYDDDLSTKELSASELATYKVTTSDANSDTEVSTDNAAKTYTFTFTGTGIDIYCTTHGAGGYVTHGLYKGTNATTANLVSGSKASIRNYSSTSRYNIPTISYMNLDYGTYTVKVSALKGARYQLDGVRVYNTVGTADNTGTLVQDESYYNGEAASEVNATYTELRTMLVNDQIASTQITDGIGYFYTDNVNKSIKYVVNEDGETVSEEVDSYTLEAYTIDGPKHEIYLPKGSGIAFSITNWSAIKENGAQIMIGMSAPEGGSATVKVSDGTTDSVDAYKEVTVDSAVDQYITVTPSDSGNIMIVNNSADAAMLSVSKLKVSGCATIKYTPEISKGETTVLTSSAKRSASVKEAPMYLTISEDTVSYAKAFNTLSTVEEIETDTEPDTPSSGDGTVTEPDTPSSDEPTIAPDPTPTPSPTIEPNQDNGSDNNVINTIQKAVKSVINTVKSLFRKLFGR